MNVVDVVEVMDDAPVVDMVAMAVVVLDMVVVGVTVVVLVPGAVQSDER